MRGLEKKITSYAAESFRKTQHEEIIIQLSKTQKLHYTLTGPLGSYQVQVMVSRGSNYTLNHLGC